MYIKAILYGRALVPALLIAAALLSTGCKKSGGYPISPGTTYLFAGYVQLRTARAFAHSGEILDTTVLAGLLAENTGYLSDAAIKASPPISDSIYFATSDSGTIFGYWQGFNFHLRRSGNDLTFTATSMQILDLDTTFVTAVDSAILLYPLLLTNRTYLPGPFYRYRFTIQAFATQSAANQMSLPGMIRVIRKPTVEYISGIVNNKFNPAFDYRLLPAGDTLIFRECSMLMQKE